MYRPNRIGTHTIGNLDKVLVVDSVANFDALRSNDDIYSAYSLNVVSQERFIKEHVYFSVAAGPTLLDVSQVGFGVQVVGTSYNRNYVYEVTGSISWTSVITTGLIIECVLGRLAGAPSAVAAIVVANPIVIPINYAGNQTVNYASVKETVITSLLDGGTPPATEFDICAFWRVNNVSGSTVALNGLQVNIGVHKYVADLETNDPNR